MAGRSSSRLLLEAKRSAGSVVVLIGIIVASLATAAIIAGKLTFERPWDSYVTVRAEFQDLKGIFPGGDSVRIHGVIVGIVSKASLVDGKPIAQLDILKQYGPIYKNAELRIRPVTPLDDLYIDVTDRGTPSAGVASGTSYVLPVTQTVTPVDISRILDTFNANTRDRLTILFSELDQGLPDGGVRLRAAFAQLAPFLTVAQQATSVLAVHQQDVRELVHNFGVLSGALADREAALTGFIRAGDSVTRQLAASSSPLENTLLQLADLLPTARTSFANVSALTTSLDPALHSLTPVAAHLASGLNALGRLGTEALPAVRALRPAVDDLRTMAVQLAPTATSLDTSFSRLSPQAPEYNAITSQLVPCLTPIRDFFNNTLSVLKYGDVNGSYPRADETVDLDAGATAAGSDLDLNTRPIPDCSGAVK